MLIYTSLKIMDFVLLNNDRPHDNTFQMLLIAILLIALTDFKAFFLFLLTDIYFEVKI